MNKTTNIGGYEVNIVLLTAIVAAVIFLLLLWALAMVRAYRKREILSRFSPTRGATLRLFRLAFGRKNVITNINLPVFSGDALSHYIGADTIVFTKRCIFLVNIRTEAGLVYCEDGFDWHQSARLRSGGTLETDFSSPVDQSDRAADALRVLIKRADLDEPTIRNIVVFTPKTTRFSCVRPNVFKLPDACRVIKKGAGNARISRESAKNYKKLILTNSLKKSAAESFNVKNMN